LMFSNIIDRLNMQKRFNCSTCHESFATRATLEEHKTKSHPGNQQASWEQKKN
jgi:hypothetical protein